MATRRESIVLEIIGTRVGDRYRRCDEHNVCGVVVEEDVVVRLRKEQMLVDGKEETAIAVHWVTGGDDRCRLGFLKRSMVMHALRYDGVLAQVTRVLGGGAQFSTAERRLYHQNMGCCYATIISELNVKKEEVKVEGAHGYGRQQEECKKRACDLITLD